MTLPCSSVGLIPQVGKMGLGVVLKKADFDDGEGSAVIGDDNIFLTDGGSVSNSVLVEYVNQMVAAIQGYNDKLNGKEPPKGFFVGIQDAEFHKPARAGDEIRLTGKMTEKVGQVSFISGDISRKGEPIARLVTKIFEITNEFPVDMPPAAQSNADGPAPVNPESAPAGVSSPLRRKLYSYLDRLQNGNGTVAFHINYPAAFDAYDGHFPGTPILPGITMLETGILAMELWAKRPVELRKVNKMKISGAVLPGQDVTCEVKITKNGDGLIGFSANFRGEDGRAITKFGGEAAMGS